MHLDEKLNLDLHVTVKIKNTKLSTNFIKKLITQKFLSIFVKIL